MLSTKALSISPSATLLIDAKAKQLKADGFDIVGFGAGEPDFDTPQHIKEAAVRAIADGFTKYTPAAGTVELREAIAKKLKTENEIPCTAAGIVVSNGAKQALVNAFRAVCNPGDEVLIPGPFWVSYPEMVKLADGVPVIVPSLEQEGFKVSPSKLETYCSAKTKAIIVNSPNNPTGMVYSETELRAIADWAVKKGIYIIADEIYEKLVYGGVRHGSIASFGDRARALTITVNGMSKAYAMTGWRIGYTASSPEIAKVMANMQSHTTSNPNSIAQKAAFAALAGPQDALFEMVSAFKERRDYMVRRIRAIPGLSCPMPDGAFYVLMNVSELFGKQAGGIPITGSDDFASALLEQGLVALVPGSGFGIDTHVRLSYATSMETIREGLDRIERFCAALR